MGFKHRGGSRVGSTGVGVWVEQSRPSLDPYPHGGLAIPVPLNGGFPQIHFARLLPLIVSKILPCFRRISRSVAAYKGKLIFKVSDSAPILIFYRSERSQMLSRIPQQFSFHSGTRSLRTSASTSAWFHVMLPLAGTLPSTCSILPSTIAWLSTKWPLFVSFANTSWRMKIGKQQCTCVISWRRVFFGRNSDT